MAWSRHTSFYAKNKCTSAAMQWTRSWVSPWVVHAKADWTNQTRKLNKKRPWLINLYLLSLWSEVIYSVAPIILITLSNFFPLLWHSSALNSGGDSVTTSDRELHDRLLRAICTCSGALGQAWYCSTWDTCKPPDRALAGGSRWTPWWHFLLERLPGKRSKICWATSDLGLIKCHQT